MAQTIVNLAQALVEYKVNEVLNSFPGSTHQAIFSGAALHEQLVAYVLKRIPAEYITTQETELCSIDTAINCFSKAQHHQVNQLIHEGIQHILSQDGGSEPSTRATSYMAGSSLSTWFG
jgi:hypothetical protein